VLGARVAQVMQQFEFPVNGWSRTAKRLPGVRGFTGAAQFHDFLASSRVLVNLLPLTPDTANLLNHDTLSRLQPGGYLINVARGSVVDEDALVAALTAGTIAGAGLDVFANEPHVPEALWTLPNVVLTPHMASATVQTRQAMADLAFANMVAGVEGQPVLTMVLELQSA